MSERKPAVWIATPLRHLDYSGAMTKEVFAGLKKSYTQPIEELASQPDLPWDINIMITGGGSVFRGRNRLVSDFMQTPGGPDDRLFFVDYDLLPTAQDYAAILSWNLEIIGGLYTIRAENAHWVMNKLPGAVPHSSGLLQVMELGTGFKCFKRSAFEKTLTDNPWIDCDSDFDKRRREFGFFSVGPVWDKKLWPGRGRILTEDYWFDWICRESGIPTWVDTKVKLRHKDEDTGRIYPPIFPDDPGVLPPEIKEP